MGKKYYSIIACLAFTGAVVASILTYLHYYPGVDVKFIFCGGDYAGNCDALNQWTYSTIFGIPIAGYGLFMFLLILFTTLMADYAGGAYSIYGLILILSLVILSLLADAFLFTVMIRFQTVCTLCVLTYIINMLLLLTVYSWYRHLKKHDGVSLDDGFRHILPRDSDSPEKKAISALYVIFVIFLFFAIFSTSHILQLKTYSVQQSKDKAKQAIETFYQQAKENPVLPESRLRMGEASARVQIVAFTDFLCSACFQLFQLENDVYAKYGDKIAVTYYNYPLDQSCNNYVQQTVYKSSCTASKAVLASASLDIFTEYLGKHFSHYQEFHSQYSRDKAIGVASELTDPVNFQEKLDSDSINQILKRDIELAESLHINATPTLFINGRRIEGVPPREVLEGIITRELRNNSTK